MSDDTESPNRFPWPPVLYVSAIAVAAILNYAYPLPWIGRPLSDFLFAIGCIMLVAVVAIDVAAMRTLSRAKTTVMPHRATAHLVTRGPYAFTRNPIYLGNTMLMIGIGFVSGIAWFPILAVAAAFVTQKLAIEREERHLTARFGKAYRDYKKKVRRWI